MLIAPILAVHNETTQTVMPKSMVLDLGEGERAWKSQFPYKYGLQDA